MGQLTLQGVTPEKLRLGLVLAIFSSVGFESATSLGSEARDSFDQHPARREVERHLGRRVLFLVRIR